MILMLKTRPQAVVQREAVSQLATARMTKPVLCSRKQYTINHTIKQLQQQARTRV